MIKVGIIHEININILLLASRMYNSDAHSSLYEFSKTLNILILSRSLCHSWCLPSASLILIVSQKLSIKTEYSNYSWGNRFIAACLTTKSDSIRSKFKIYSVFWTWIKIIFACRLALAKKGRIFLWTLVWSTDVMTEGWFAIFTTDWLEHVSWQNIPHMFLKVLIFWLFLTMMVWGYSSLWKKMATLLECKI